VISSSRKCPGRLFQTRGPATAKFLSPNVLCERGTTHDLSVDERRRRRGPSETRCMLSDRYEGAWPDRDEKTKYASLKLEASRGGLHTTKKAENSTLWIPRPIVDYYGHVEFNELRCVLVIQLSGRQATTVTPVRYAPPHLTTID